MILISLLDMIINHRKMLSAHGALVKEPNIVKLTGNLCSLSLQNIKHTLFNTKFTFFGFLNRQEWV
jgi:hypothetical protein